MNIELLRKVQKHILEEPKRLDMGTWLCTDLLPGDPLTPTCGTVGCISGWASQLSGQLEVGENTGARLMDLNREQAILLFYEENWPHRLFDELQEFESQTRQYAEIVSKRIDLFIATDGRE